MEHMNPLLRPTHALTTHFIWCRSAPLLVACLALASCASTGSGSASLRPVLYPNAAYQRVGDVQAQNEVAACQSRAGAAGLRAEQGSQVVQRAGESAAVAGVASAVGALVFGRGTEGVLRAGAGGAAIGSVAGATQAVVRGGQQNPVYRSFVQRCLSEKGFDVIGWN